jgi:hypothetical protein
VRIKPKTAALVLLGVVSLVCPMVEVVMTGSSDPFGPYALADAVASLVPIFWWYHIDKQERSYRAGPLMNGGMIAITIVALPIYFVRTRGWKRGGIAILVAALVFAVMMGLDEIGERIGMLFASA